MPPFYVSQGWLTLRYVHRMRLNYNSAGSFPLPKQAQTPTINSP
jgi:hypothetical protein